MKKINPNQKLLKAAVTGTILGAFLALAIYFFFDHSSAMFFLIGYSIFLFSLFTTALTWPRLMAKKQVALGTLLIVSKYLTFFLFMSFLVEQSWPASLWLIVGFVASKVIVLSGYFIFKKD